MSISLENTNDIKVYNALGFSPKTRGELVKETGIPRTTCYDALIRLITRYGLVEWEKEKRSAKGRFCVVWKRKE